MLFRSTIYNNYASTSTDNLGNFQFNQIVGGACQGVWTNGTSFVGNVYVTTTDNRVYYTTNLYNLNNSYGNVTGRVILKA